MFGVFLESSSSVTRKIAEDGMLCRLTNRFFASKQPVAETFISCMLPESDFQNIL